MAVSGEWNIVINSPMGERTGVLTLEQEGDTLSGQLAADVLGTSAIENGKVDGDTLSWDVNITAPLPMTLEFDALINGGDITGSVVLGAFGKSPFKGTAL